MATKDEKLEAQQEAEATANAVSGTQTPSETPNRDKWFANMRGKYGEDKSEEELYDLSSQGYDAEHEANKRYAEEALQLEDILKDNPELGTVFSEIFERGKDGNPAGALRNLPDELKRYITDENYGDEAYLADKKAREEEAAAKDERDKKIEELRTRAFEEVCNEDGIADPEAALAALKGVFENPCETLEQCKEQARAFLKMVNYEDAVEAAKVQGRNENIVTQRKKSASATDGQVNGGSASAGAAEPAKLSRMSQIAKNREYARNL